MMEILREAKSQIIRKLSYLSEGVYFVSPEELGEQHYRKRVIYQFPRNPYYLRENINTVTDLILYVRASFFRPRMGDLRVREGEMIWHFNRTGPETICANKGNCGGISSMLAFVLKDNYEDVGFIAFTDQVGGHVFNYIKHRNKYYFIDLLNYLYASKSMEHHSTMIYQADSLQTYADYYRKRAKKNIKIMISYSGNQVLPIGRYQQEPLMFLPEGSQYHVLHESPQEGIVVREKKVYQCPEPLNNCVSIVHQGGISTVKDDLHESSIWSKG